MERQVVDESAQPGVEAIIEAFKEEAEHPIGNDRYFGRFARAIIPELESGVLGELIDTDLKDQVLYKALKEPYHAVQFIARSFQRQFLKKFPATYPIEFSTAQVYSEAIQSVVADPDALFSLQTDFAIHEIQSNVSDRYKAIKLIAQMYEPRLGANPNILDVGCSLNLGLKRLARSQDHPFGAIKVRRGTLDDNRINKRLTTSANELLFANFSLGLSLGADVVATPKDQNTKDWIRSCSFYPSELLNPALVMEFDDLVNEEVPNVGFCFTDFTTPAAADDVARRFAHMHMQAKATSRRHETSLLEEASIFAAEKEELFDLITFCTTMYLMNEQQHYQALAIARKLLKPSGLVVVQDFAAESPASSIGLEFHNDFQYESFPYRTYVYDPQDPDFKPNHLFSFDGGRCRELLLGAGHVALEGALLTPEEALQKGS